MERYPTGANNSSSGSSRAGSDVSIDRVRIKPAVWAISKECLCAIFTVPMWAVLMQHPLVTYSEVVVQYLAICAVARLGSLFLSAEGERFRATLNRDAQELRAPMRSGTLRWLSVHAAFFAASLFVWTCVRMRPVLPFARAMLFWAVMRAVTMAALRAASVSIAARWANAEREADEMIRRFSRGGR